MEMKKIAKYELREEIGRGAMGIVYKAYDTLLDRDVALKIMIHADQTSSENKKRFYREARSAGSLMHDNIVKVFDLGEDDDAPYIAMEYLPGRDLKELIRDGTLTKYIDILKIWFQICAGLHHAHKRGLVHRDIKPGNIRITPDDRVKIMDFGIAKKPSSDLTQSGVVLGTVDYMAPEQVKGTGANSRSDLFSLGVMFYEMMTGRKPFPGDSITSVIYKIVYEEPAPMRPLLIQAPYDVDEIIGRLLAKNPLDRYPTAKDVSKALKQSYLSWRSRRRREREGAPPTSEQATIIDPDRTVAARPPTLTETQEETLLAAPPATGNVPPATRYVPPATGNVSRPTGNVSRPTGPAPTLPTAEMPPPRQASAPGTDPMPVASFRSPTMPVTVADLPLRPGGEPLLPTTPSLPPPAPPAFTAHRSGVLLLIAVGLGLGIAFGGVLGAYYLGILAPRGAIVRPNGGTKSPPTTTPSTVVAVPPGKLTLKSNLPAQILVDGIVRGELPIHVPLDIPSGSHRLVLRAAPSGAEIAREIEIQPDKTTNLDLPFKGDGFVRFRVRPWANVTIDGDTKSIIEVQAASDRIPIPAGPHRFTFQQLGNRIERTADIAPGETKIVTVDMAAGH